MDITLRLAFDEQAAVRLLNWLARENALIFEAAPDLPGLYASGVVYKREKGELWSDYRYMLLSGHEDCDALSAARAGELFARGAAALEPGDGGYADAVELGLESIYAEVFLRTRTRPGQPGMYHCLTRYFVNGHWYRDDPSARLGMYGGQFRPNPWGDRPEPLTPERPPEPWASEVIDLGAHRRRRRHRRPRHARRAA